MIYIFEDKRDDIISRFFMQAYTEEALDKFKYTDGNGNIVKAVERELKVNNDNIAVYLDVVPGNRCIISIYNNLKQLSKENNYRVIVFPIVCSEYYLILSLQESQALRSRKGLYECINKLPYDKSELIETDKDREFCKNFEKYCKLVILKDCKDCAGGSSEDSKRTEMYYAQSCLCLLCDNSCKDEKVEYKVSRFVAQYPILPAGLRPSLHSYYRSIEDAWNVHRALVDEFNNMCDRFKNADCLNSKKYRWISVIK